MRQRLTVADSCRMGRGESSRSTRVSSLIEGSFIDMATIGAWHAAVSRLIRVAKVAVGVNAVVSRWKPLHLSEVSEPEPDPMLLKPRADFYANATPALPICCC